MTSRLSTTADQLYFVYVLVDPRDGSPRYVGQTANQPAVRLAQHCRSKSRTAKERWIDELALLELRPELVVLAEYYGTRRNAYLLESAVIARFRQDGHKLLNVP